MQKLVILFAFLCSPLLAVSNYVTKDYSHLLGMPGFSDDLLNLHFKLYEGYVKNTNELLTKLQALSGSSSYEYGALKRRFGWEFDGMRLHELYFDNLGGKDPLSDKNPLYAQMVSDFGSYDAWKADF